MTREQKMVFDYASERIEALNELIAVIEKIENIGPSSLGHLNELRGKVGAFKEILNMLQF